MKEPYQKGRGAQLSVPNRFISQYTETDDLDPEELPVVKTQFLEDHSRRIVNPVTSPDLSFAFSANPYQGCEHGCVYCYARDTHQYWGYNSGIDFESKIIVKKNAPALLETYLTNFKGEVKPVVLSGNTDCYQPGEKKYRLTRQMLEIFLKFRYPVSIITKNSLIERDRDILAEMAGYNLVHVNFSLTTRDEKLRRIMEPRTASTVRKLKVMKDFSDLGISTGLMVAPVIPGLNHHEIPQLLALGHQHGARTAGYTMLRLNGTLGPVFKDWLKRHYPDRADKVIHQVEAVHGGKINDSEFGRRMKGGGPYAKIVKQLFNTSFKRYFGSEKPEISLNTGIFRRGGHYRLF